MHGHRSCHIDQPFTQPTSDIAHEDLIQRICSLASTDRPMAQHLINEMLHYFNDTPEAFITRRHRELQQAGLNNTKIYTIIAEELQSRCFHCPDMSLRQIRRVIYG